MRWACASDSVRCPSWTRREATLIHANRIPTTGAKICRARPTTARTSASPTMTSARASPRAVQATVGRAREVRPSRRTRRSFSRGASRVVRLWSHSLQTISLPAARSVRAARPCLNCVPVPGLRVSVGRNLPVPRRFRRPWLARHNWFISLLVNIFYKAIATSTFSYTRLSISLSVRNWGSASKPICIHRAFGSRPDHFPRSTNQIVHNERDGHRRRQARDNFLNCPTCIQHELDAVRCFQNAWDPPGLTGFVTEAPRVICAFYAFGFPIQSSP